METKRCAYCRKLQRADTQMCSRCGHVFVQKRLRPAKKEWTQPSIPPASPHRAGHYAGLHPEDQPYQSSKITVRRMTTEDIEQWHHTLPEPEHIILPTADPVSDPAIQLPPNMLLRQTESSVEDLPAVEESPSYIPRKRLLPQRAIPILLVLSAIFFLLASSVFAFVWIKKSSSGGSINPHVTITKTLQRSSVATPALQLSASSLDLGADAPGTITSKTLEIFNTGGKQIIGQSDEPWLTASPASTTSSNRESMRIMVNRGTLAPDAYTGHILFTPEGESRGSSLKLTAIMAVSTAPAVFTVSPPTLSFSLVMGQSQPIYKAIILKNDGYQSLTWSASVSTQDQGNWLSADSDAGTLDAGGENFMNAKVNVQGMQRGFYQGTLTLTAGDEIRQIAISLTVS